MKNKTFNINILIFLFPFLIICGKIIRWTLMKTVLVEAGIGHSFLVSILGERETFQLLLADFTGNAGGNTIVIFTWINRIFELTTYEEFEILISIVWNLILLYLIISCKKSLKLGEFIFLALSVMVLNIFDFCLAKEPIQMLYFLLIYFILTRKKMSSREKNILSLSVVALSVLTFRAYYVLILIFAILLQILCKIFIIKKDKINYKHIIKIIVILGVSYFILLNIVKIISPTHFNELLRVRLRTSSAASDMRSLFNSTNLIIFTIDYLIMLIRMLFPIELLPLGIKYLPYVLYQLVITFFTIKSIKNIKSNSKEKNIALFIFMGFLFASATFEPDFGSWVRHEASTFPIMLIVAEISRKEQKDGGINEQNKKDISKI